MKSILLFFALLVFTAAQSQNSPSVADTAIVKEFRTIQIQAQFPGGIAAWTKYLQKNLHAEVGADNISLRRGQKDSLQSVVVSFLVDTSGNVTEAKVENPAFVHPKVGAEAVRVVKNGPKWIPATQNGQKVIYRQKQTISFEVTRG